MTAGAQLTALLEDPGQPGVTAALGLVDGFDDALADGLGRVTPGHGAALHALAAAVTGTPIGERATEAAGKLTAGSVTDEYLLTMAAARSALLGAAHDALLTEADVATGRQRSAHPSPPSASGTDAEHDDLLAGARSWLREIAAAGWRGLDHDLVSAVAPTVRALLALPPTAPVSHRRLAVLLDGLAAELQAAATVTAPGDLPVRRWADLWCRALILGRADPGHPGPATVSGRLLVLGVEVHEHPTAAQVRVHGVLESDGQVRLVRVNVSAAKVDSITGRALWSLFTPHVTLRQALAKQVALMLTDVPLTSGGDLLWDDDRAAPGPPADPFVTARAVLPAAVAASVHPLERHPVALAEPVLVEGWAVADGVLLPPGADEGLPLALHRLPSAGPLTPDLIRTSSGCIGLLGWDGGRWSLQPLAVRIDTRAGTTVRHNGEWATGHPDPKVARADAADDPVTVLRERAGRLLR